MKTILYVLALTSTLAAFGSGITVGLDIANLWQGPDVIKNAAYNVLAWVIVIAVLVDSAVVVTSRR